MPRPPRLSDKLLFRAFGRPIGLLGRVGGRIMARTNRETAERAVALLDVQPNDRVLEIGFGPGVAIELLARAASSGHIVGIDPSGEMHRQAQSRNAEAIRARRVELKSGSAENLPFEDGAFDKALAINSMQLWPDVPASLRELHRVLAPGGKLVLAFTRHSHQTPEGLIGLLGRAGFPAADLHSDPEQQRFFVAASRP